MAPKQRTSIPGPRVTGTIVDWKEKFGWIEATKPVNHPSASKRQGKIFIGIEDVVEELDGVGATVSFTLYSDVTGLGAADVKMAKAPITTPAKGTAKGASNGKTPAKGKAPPAKAAAKAPAGKGKNKRPAPVVEEEEQEEEEEQLEEEEQAEEEEEATEPEPKRFKGDGKSFGKGKWKGDGKGKGKWKDDGKGKGKKGKKKGKGEGPGPRTMIHDEPLVGTVVDWRGKFGWIKPNDTIEHELAQKHQGDLYFTADDVLSEIDGVDSVVQFMLYQDNKGLGACDVQPAE